VLEHLGRDDPVERAVGEGHGERVAPNDRAERLARRLALLVHGPQDGGGPQELVVVAVERHDVGAAPEGLERVAPAAAPQVEEAVAALHAEAVVVDRQHAPARARARSSARYCSTVPLAVAAQV
jgi:hypothetical protein